MPNSSSSWHFVLSSLASFPLGHKSQIPPRPARPSGHGVHTSLLGLGQVPSGHVSQMPPVPAIVCGHGWQTSLPGASSEPSGQLLCAVVLSFQKLRIVGTLLFATLKPSANWTAPGDELSSETMLSVSSDKLASFIELNTLKASISKLRGSGGIVMAYDSSRLPACNLRARMALARASDNRRFTVMVTDTQAGGAPAVLARPRSTDAAKATD